MRVVEKEVRKRRGVRKVGEGFDVARGAPPFVVFLSDLPRLAFDVVKEAGGEKEEVDKARMSRSGSGRERRLESE